MAFGQDIQSNTARILVSDKRCDLNIRNNSGDTALHLAVCSERNGIQKAQVLLQSDRCNPNTVSTSNGLTPLILFISRNSFKGFVSTT